MIVRRTGAKRGQSPVWYVYADRTEEQTAIDTGTLTDQSPDARWRHVLAWGFESQEAAEAWIEDCRDWISSGKKLESFGIAADRIRERIDPLPSYSNSGAPQ